MLFNTPDFVIFFITVIGVLVLFKNRRFQHVFILIASYFFFYYSSNYLITLLIYTTIWDFYFGNAIWNTSSKGKKKILLVISLAGNLGILGFFKYADFTISQINALSNSLGLSSQIPFLNLALPIGISFYTFHSITYTVGIYRQQFPPAKSFTEYAIFVAFFPQLVAGPILRAKDFLPQLREKISDFETGTRLRQILIDHSNLKIGITMMAIGFFKKMFFADNIAPMVKDVFSSPVGLESFTIIMGAISFGIQIYCDFSGYTDIALGAATIMGFKIPINFNRPYFATSPSEFWRRWHISLSSWLKEYLYVGLGGNRKSKTRTILNIFIVMFLGGLWHGASWNFVLWGLLHGSYLTIQKFFFKKIMPSSVKSFFSNRIGLVISIFITQYFVFLAWIPFRVKNINDLLYSMEKYIVIDFKTETTYHFILSHKFSISLVLIFIVMIIISYKKDVTAEKISNYRIRYWAVLLIAIVCMILLFYNGNPESFIYFQF